MSRKTVSGIMLVLLVSSMLALAFNIQSVKAGGTITIRADGSIDPPTAPIYTADNITYTLTGNITADVDGIVIERDYIVLNGAGYTVTGSGSGNGISLTGDGNVTVRNITIENFTTGIYLYSSSGNTLSGNNVTNNGCGIGVLGSSGNTLSGNNVTANSGDGIFLYFYSSNNILFRNNVTANKRNGIYLFSSSNNTLSGNMMSGNRCNFAVFGTTLGNYLQSVDSSNLVDGKPINYFVNQSNLVVNAAAYPEIGYLGFVNCFNVTAQGLNLTGNGHGLLVAFTSDSKIAGNNVANNSGSGIDLEYSSNNTLSGNTVTANGGGGISLVYGSDNVLSGNNVTANSGDGIQLYSEIPYPSGNTLSGNIVANNQYGITLGYSYNNFIFHNSFVNNTNQVSIVSNSGPVNIWDNGYPSGGNYWSDYATRYPNATEIDSSGLWNTPYVIDGTNTDNYPLISPSYLPDLAIYGLSYSCSQPPRQHSGMVKGTVHVRNNGNNSETGNVKIYANSSVIWSQSLVLQPHLNYSLDWTWNTVGYCGQYQISAYIEPVKDELYLQNNRLMRSYYYVNVLGKGYCIIVAGNYQGDLLGAINDGCNQAYKVLRSVGYSPSDICYMNQQQLGYQDVDGDGINDIDIWSSSANLRWAIETWALSRVNPSQPLTIYIFDHGNKDTFSINWPDYVTSTDLSSWLDYLQQATGAEINVIYAACHSGSFINELSKNNRVIVTSSSPNENSKLDPSGTGEAFSIPFWNEIKSGHSVLLSFNYAYSVIAPKWFWQYWWPFSVIWPTQTPLLDDNGDGVGHGGSLPVSGDGSVAGNIYIGSCEWPDPWISQVMPRSYSSWPPSNITLWAIVKNETNLSHVRAWMLPPDWSPPNSTDTLLSLNLECYEMAEIGDSGNWTVNIPAVNFTNHASNPANFTFFITAEEENGDMATPSLATIAFSESGMPPQDTVSPSVHLERPLEESVVTGTVVLNGTASDDVCLDRVEVYADDNLLGTVGMLPTSTSYFEFGLDTTIFPNGNRTALVKVYDKSGNSDNETVTFFVENYVHDVSVTATSMNRTIIGQGSTAQIGVTIANHGSYSETFNLTVYANTTLIATALVTLSDQNYATLTFTWNTTGFAYGNYTISAYAWPVDNETNTADNNCTGGWVWVSGVGDLTGGTPNALDFVPDGRVDITDVAVVARFFSQKVPPAPANCDVSGSTIGVPDGKIDITDVATVAKQYGNHYTYP